MVAEICFNLSALRLVCHLVALSNITNSDVSKSIGEPDLTHSQPMHRANHQLPDYYVAFPDIGVAYKYHWHSTTWPQAMQLCHQEGAVLAAIDSAEKVRILFNWGLPKSDMHVGIVRLDGTNWISVKTGTSPSSIPWMSSYPTSTTTRNCATFHPNNDGLTNNHACQETLPFVCEVPILSTSTIAAN